MSIVTPHDLAHALSRALELPPDEAALHAERLLDLFGFDDQLIDNRLEAEDRQLFYALQDTGLLATRAEETELWNGHTWRTHYWVLRIERVAGAARVETARDRADEGAVYAALPPDAWARR